MKSFKLLLLTLLLLVGSAVAMTAKIKEPKIKEGTSVGKYQKPGVPVNIRYTSEQVEAGEESKIHIILLTAQTSGTMKVKLKIDHHLEQVTKVEKNLSFDLVSGEGEYPVDLTVMGEEDGLYYVRLIVSIKGKGMRAFAVPVYVGDGKLKAVKKTVEKTKRGENITVSPAAETIER